ncbi:MAG: cyclic nucleotide-binding protein [uncultured bacterium]|nr:MAG: cyclic nucleotide-binding protein [uncultured bacterium]
MREQKLNCWEFKKCGRELNGRNVQEMGVCPATLDDSFDGINSGTNGGRICWAVAGTFCEGIKQGAFHAKRQSCVKCDFFSVVSRQEGASDTPTKLLKFLTDTNDASFLGELTYRWVKAGERFLVQGVVEDTAYITPSTTASTPADPAGSLPVLSVTIK